MEIVVGTKLTKGTDGEGYEVEDYFYPPNYKTGYETADIALIQV